MPPKKGKRKPERATAAERTPEEIAMRRERENAERLIKSVEKLIDTIINKFVRRGALNPRDVEAVRSDVYLRLIGCAKRFDPAKATWVTYVHPHIKGVVRRFLRDKLAHTTGMARDEIRNLLSKVNIIQSQGVTNPKKIAKRLGLSVETVQNILRWQKGETFFSELRKPDQLRKLDGEHFGLYYSPLFESAESLSMPLPINLEADAISRVDLHKALTQLKQREREIIILRFFGGMSQLKVGDKFGISQMHVSRLERRALARLKVLLTKELPKKRK